MKYTLAFFTSTRSDMTILEPLINRVKKNKKFNYLLFVHGTHLEKKYGNTINNLKNLKFKITANFRSIDKSDDSFGLAESLRKAQKNINILFKKFTFDAVVILGDRLERLPIVSCAIAYRKLIFHIQGGEITEGALDEQVRHMITKSAHLHFTICERYKKNILKLAEEKFRVHNVGSLAVEKLLKQKKNSLVLKKRNLVILTYHPETINLKFQWKNNFAEIIKAINEFNYEVLITSPGHEKGSIENINYIKNLILKYKKFKFVESLGADNYFKYLNMSKFVIGNSSSGIIEVPYFRIPTINIGIRQKGRFLHDSVIQTECKYLELKKSIIKANSKKFNDKIKKMNLYFGKGDSSSRILNIIKKEIKNKDKLLYKKFSSN